MWLQLPFQNGMATFCSLKIVAAMTKMARVPSSMQKLVFLKVLQGALWGTSKLFYHKKRYIPMCYTQFLWKIINFFVLPDKSQITTLIQLKQSLSDENKQPKPILFSIILFSDFCFYHLVE